MKIGRTNEEQVLPGAEAAGQAHSRKNDPAKLDKAAREFEAYFVQLMMKEMRKNIPKSGLLGGGDTRAMFESMLDEAVAKNIAEGPGLGLARQLKAYLGDDEGGLPSLPRTPGQSFAAPQSTTWPAWLRGRNPYQEEESGAADIDRKISSGFGERMHPILHERRFHRGIDLPMPEGTSVYPAAPGVVTFAGERSGYGNLVIVSHPNGYTTRYAHNSKILVEEGQEVTRETALAQSGNTGLSTGPHLHFEVRKDEEAIDPTTVSWVRLK